ncbi:hypothetical protein L5515_017824 [Caenorhabditis briggsae]|uniref:SAP domain-containing protein n=2 Tax=Caenorhabditis briggsae TaxID=6238 RepID=A0AAE9JQQ3_CAEBR|nr:hypothetical protein L5515_017824 [Caenorhabditis briggsae]
MEMLNQSISVPTISNTDMNSIGSYIKQQQQQQHHHQQQPSQMSGPHQRPSNGSNNFEQHAMIPATTGGDPANRVFNDQKPAINGHLLQTNSLQMPHQSMMDTQQPNQMVSYNLDSRNTSGGRLPSLTLNNNGFTNNVQLGNGNECQMQSQQQMHQYDHQNPLNQNDASMNFVPRPMDVQMSSNYGQGGQSHYTMHQSGMMSDSQSSSNQINQSKFQPGLPTGSQMISSFQVNQPQEQVSHLSHMDQAQPPPTQHSMNSIPQSQQHQLGQMSCNSSQMGVSGQSPNISSNSMISIPNSSTHNSSQSTSMLSAPNAPIYLNNSLPNSNPSDNIQEVNVTTVTPPKANEILIMQEPRLKQYGSLNDMSTNELRAESKLRAISSTGNKSKLCGRLEPFEAEILAAKNSFMLEDYNTKRQLYETQSATLKDFQEKKAQTQAQNRSAAARAKLIRASVDGQPPEKKKRPSRPRKSAHPRGQKGAEAVQEVPESVTEVINSLPVECSSVPTNADALLGRNNEQSATVSYTVTQEIQQSQQVPNSMHVFGNVSQNNGSGFFIKDDSCFSHLGSGCRVISQSPPEDPQISSGAGSSITRTFQTVVPPPPQPHPVSQSPPQPQIQSQQSGNPQMQRFQQPDHQQQIYGMAEQQQISQDQIQIQNHNSNHNHDSLSQPQSQPQSRQNSQPQSIQSQSRPMSLNNQQLLGNQNNMNQPMPNMFNNIPTPVSMQQQMQQPMQQQIFTPNHQPVLIASAETGLQASPCVADQAGPSPNMPVSDPTATTSGSPVVMGTLVENMEAAAEAMDQETMQKLLSPATLRAREDLLTQQQAKINELVTLIQKHHDTLREQQHQINFAKKQQKERQRQNPTQPIAHVLDQHVSSRCLQHAIKSRQNVQTLSDLTSQQDSIRTAETRLIEQLHINTATDDIARLIKQDGRTALVIVSLLHDYRTTREQQTHRTRSASVVGESDDKSSILGVTPSASSSSISSATPSEDAPKKKAPARKRNPAVSGKPNSSRKPAQRKRKLEVEEIVQVTQEEIVYEDEDDEEVDQFLKFAQPDSVYKSDEQSNVDMEEIFKTVIDASRGPMDAKTVEMLLQGPPQTPYDTELMSLPSDNSSPIRIQSQDSAQSVFSEISYSKTMMYQLDNSPQQYNIGTETESSCSPVEVFVSPNEILQQKAEEMKSAKPENIKILSQFEQVVIDQDLGSQQYQDPMMYDKCENQGFLNNDLDFDFPDIDQMVASFKDSEPLNASLDDVDLTALLNGWNEVPGNQNCGSQAQNMHSVHDNMMYSSNQMVHHQDMNWSNYSNQTNIINQAFEQSEI